LEYIKLVETGSNIHSQDYDIHSKKRYYKSIGIRRWKK